MKKRGGLYANPAKCWLVLVAQNWWTNNPTLIFTETQFLTRKTLNLLTKLAQVSDSQIT